MAFRLDIAAETLRSTLDALATSWPQIDPIVRSRLEAAIRQFAPPVFCASSATLANRLAAFLGALWAERDNFPAAAVEALQAGQGATERLVRGVDAETYGALEASVLRIADPRYYRDPVPLARTVRGLIKRNQDRLTEAERSSWQALDVAYLQLPENYFNADVYLRQVERLLADYPPVTRLLARDKTWVRTLGGQPDGAVEVPSGAAHGEGQTAFQRYANVHFPATVLMQQRHVPLIVHLATEHAEGSLVGPDGSAVTVQPGDLTVLLHADGFDVVGALGGLGLAGSAVRTVSAAANRDCEPIVFFLNPLSAGPKRVSVDIYQADRNIATLSFITNVVEQVAGETIGSAAVERVALLFAGSESLPPDLELRVALSGDRQTLTYTLHSPGGSDYNFQPAGQAQLNGDPRDILQRQADRLSRLARLAAETRTPEITQAARQEMADMGASLWDELAPPELKAEYPKIRDRYAGKSLLITSDEPWIPWEIVRPAEFDREGRPLYDDPFLCETFQVARWLAGRGAPDRLDLHCGAIVAPVDNLAYVRQEADYFAEVGRRQWELEIRGPLTTAAEVKRCFADPAVQLYHFACHGNFDATNPDDSLLKLEDDTLRPSQLMGVRGTLRQARPLVFLNACHAGRAGFALTGLAGWAEKFTDAGASVFIGTLWEINDELAARFAVAFYDRLWGLDGHRAARVGEAFHQARLEVKDADPANPTWLSYVLYGDPKGKIALGVGSEPIKS